MPYSIRLTPECFSDPCPEISYFIQILYNATWQASPKARCELVHRIGAQRDSTTALVVPAGDSVILVDVLAVLIAVDPSMMTSTSSVNTESDR